MPEPPPVDFRALFEQLPTSYMVMDLDLRYVAVNDAYLATTGRTREELLGAYVFDAFPPTPDALDEDGVPRVQRSFERARDTGRPDPMPLQEYDIPDPATGGMSERWWSLISVPVLDAAGEVVLVAQRAEDVTDWVRQREAADVALERSAELGRRVQEVESDLYKRARELQEALVGQERAAARVAGLAAVAMELTAADTVQDLCRTVFQRGLPVLGADGGAISVRDEDTGTVRLTVSRDLVDRALPAYGELPLDSPLPAAHVARTGEPLLFPTRASGLAWSPLVEDVYRATGRDAWATLPLRVGGQLLGALVVAWRAERSFPAEDVALLEGFAAQVAQALRRLTATAAERAAARATARLSEALQRSLLTAPPQPDELSVAVRYQPAAQEAEVGGDWYDAFVTEQGTPLLVVGDVSGHDRAAAASMGQVRNVLRGIAVDSCDGPAALLTRLDRAVRRLGVEALATAVLARVEGGPGERVLRWSSAGHLPPVLRGPDGRVTVLDDEPDLLLGLDPGSPRVDRVSPLAPGSLLVLYTDGLVERRDADLSTGIARVVDAVAGLGEADAERAADAVLAAGSGDEDDLAVLVLHVVPTG